MSSQDDTVLLQTIGSDLLTTFVSVLVETWALAIYTVLIFKASMILLHRDKRKSKIAKATLGIVLTMYLMDLSLWMIDVRNMVVDLRLTFITTSSDSLADRYAAAQDTILRLEIVEDVLYSYMTLLGDAIIISRVYAFWSHGKERFILILPCAVYLASIVLSCLVTFCGAQSDANLSLGAFTHPQFCQNIQATSYWTQLITAFISTALIGYKTWVYRRMISSFFGREVERSPVNKAMIILVDTGLIYTLYFVAEVVLGFPGLNGTIAAQPNLAFALQVYEFTTSSIVGIYPTLVVILVHAQCCIVDSHGNTTMTTLQFNAGTGTGRRRANQAPVTRTVGWSDTLAVSDTSEVRSRRNLHPDVSINELHSLGSSATDRLEDVKDEKDIGIKEEEYMVQV